MACADEADGAYRILQQMVAQFRIERKEWRLHGFHEEAIVRAGGGEDLLDLAEVEGCGFFAENMFAGAEGAQAEFSMSIRMGGDINGVDVSGEKRFESWGNDGHGESIRIGVGAIGFAAPDSGEGNMFNRLPTVSESCGGTARADHAPSN
jgi:hypothetical protein